MSTMHNIKYITFNKRRPSMAQVMRAVTEAVRAGERAIDVSWGENCIELTTGPSRQWTGYGWIKSISGSDIADEVNRKERQAVLNLYNT